MITLSDVAVRAGVSKSTASRALSGRGSVGIKSKEKVLSAAAELGFVPSSAAESLATGRSRNIALVTPFINRWFYAEVIDGVESALIGAGYDLTLYDLLMTQTSAKPCLIISSSGKGWMRSLL